MKMLRGMLSVLIPLLLIAAGASLLWLHVCGAGEVPAAWREEAANPLQRALVGALLVTLGVGWGVAFLTPPAGSRCVSFETPGGTVSISLAAIADFLSRLNAEFPALVSVRPEVTTGGGALAVDLQCRVRSETPIPALSRQLQDRVREVVRQTTGLSEIAEVHVTVREIVGPPPPSTANVGERGSTEFDAEPRIAEWRRD